jgi:tetratricopeptide (TPR) repeat protein
LLSQKIRLFGKIGNDCPVSQGFVQNLPGFGTILHKGASLGVKRMVRSIRLAGIALLFLFGCATTSRQPADPAEYVSRAKEYADKKEYDKALADYTRAVTLDPLCIDAYMGCGDVYASKEDFDLAIKDFTQVIAINPAYLDAYIGRGSSYLGKKDYDRAFSEYNTVIGQNPDYGKAYTALGWLYTTMGDYEQAVWAFNLAITLEPNNDQFYSSFGNACFQMNRIPQALENMEKALSINPDNWDCYLSIAMILNDRGDYEAACAKLREGIANSTKNKGFLFYMLGIIHLNNNDAADEFIVELKQTIEAGNEEYRPEFLYALLMLAYMQNNDDERAMAEMTAAITKYPKNKYLYMYRFVLYSKMEDEARAKKDIDRAIAADRGYAEAYATRAALFLDNEDYDKAVRDFNKAITLKPGLAEAHKGLGYTYYKKGDYANAINPLMETVRLKDDNMEVYYLLGRAYAAQENFDNAIECFTKIIQNFPFDLSWFQAYKYRGQAYLKKGNMKLAEEDFAMASILNADYENDSDDPEINISFNFLDF